MSTPSLATLIYRAKGTLSNKLGETNPAIEAIAAAIGGVGFGQYAYQDYLFKQLNPETADEDWLYLWANRYEVPRIDFTFATGFANFNLTTLKFVPENAILKTTSGAEYKVTEGTYSDQPVPIQAVEMGPDGNIPEATALFLVTAVTGLNPDSIESSEIAGGAELEDVEHWRERIVLAYNIKEAVGELDDYIFWARSAHVDIDRAWALDNTPQLGHVTVYIAQDAADPTLPEAVKTTTQDYINSKRLAGCHVFAEIPSKKPVEITIAGVTDINIRDAIDSALQTFFIERLSNREQMLSNEISTAISSVTTEFTLINPIAATSFENNELLTYGGTTWQ